MSDHTWPIPIGAKIRTKFGNDLDTLYHVRGHVDGRIVVRSWWKHKRRWHYEVLTEWWWMSYSPHCEVEEQP